MYWGFIFDFFMFEKKIPKKITRVINYKNVKDLDKKLKKLKADVVIHAATH